MISRHSINHSFWIDLNSPTPEEVANIAEEFELEHAITKDLLAPTPKPRMYEGGKFIYAIFHIPAFKHSHREEAQELDFCIGRNTLITARYEDLDALHKFKKETEVISILGRDEHMHSHIFFHMMREIQASLFDELSYMEDWLGSIEKKIFAGREKEMVLAISEASRNLLNFRKTIAPHREILEFLRTEGSKRFGPSFKTSMEVLIENLQRISETARNHADMVAELRETNNSLLTTKQNEITQTLTILASITIPASIIASIFNMSVELPFVNTPHIFWIIISSMITISIVMYLSFKHKHWI